MNVAKKLLSYVWQHKNIILFFLLAFVLFFINTFHEQYPDEFDNILGGWYIIHGILPYHGFFTHHGPVAYFIAAIAVIFSGQSFVHFRIVYAVMLFVYMVIIYRYLLKSIGKEIKTGFILFMGIFTIAATYFWFHMLLADNISALFILPSIVIIVIKIFYKKTFTLSDIIFFSISSALTVLSSLTYVFLVLGLYLFSFVLFIRQKKQLVRKETFYVIGIFLLPYVVFSLYLIFTQSLSDYIYQSIIFNQKYYIYNYPRPAGVTTINPIRFGVVIAHDFLNSFFSLLTQVRTFNFSYPVNITFALANVSMTVYMLSKKKYLLACFFVFCCIYSNARSNPLLSAETDYQSAVYIFISFFSVSFLCLTLYEEIKTNTNNALKFIYQLMFILVGVYSLFMTFYFVNKWNNKYYPKYMGTAPLIYDRPQIAPIINKLLTSRDYVWIGPFSFEELLYTNVRLATKYHILNPGMGMSDKISQEQVAQIEKTKPKIIWYNKNFFILGKEPAKYATLFNSMLNRDYITLYKYSNNKTHETYISVMPVTVTIDLEKYLYIRKNNVEEIIAKLIANNLIQPVAEEKEK